MKDDKQINLQTPYEIKLPTCIRKTIEYQHYRYRQRQQPALASPRRTARYERISPDGFDMAALEVTLYGGTPPPPNGGSPPLSGEAILQTCKRRKNKVDNLHRKTPECQHYRYRQGQPPALASPRRTARYERIPPDVFGVAALENCCPRASPRGCGHPYTFQERLYFTPTPTPM